MFDPPERNPYAPLAASVVDGPAHRALALDAARESLVLLKNDGVLPLDARKLKKLAIVGPAANVFLHGSAVRAANPRTILVLWSGNPLVLTPHERSLPAIVQAWYAGQDATPIRFRYEHRRRAALRATAAWPQVRAARVPSPHARAGARQRVAIDLPVEALARYDGQSKREVVDPGRYELLVGASSTDIGHRATFHAGCSSWSDAHVVDPNPLPARGELTQEFCVNLVSLVAIVCLDVGERFDQAPAVRVVDDGALGRHLGPAVVCCPDLRNRGEARLVFLEASDHSGVRVVFEPQVDRVDEHPVAHSRL
jgi:hypothetical protein